MKKIIPAAIVALSFVCSACVEEGFTKVFSCEPDYPYFSKITHKCYASESAMVDDEKSFKLENESQNESE
ncbi:MAG: hypothetical protein IJU23_08920 [Proteobacteria bacterium]|nr:hypothetical protein [Pseudomonadota bacterium]